MRLLVTPLMWQINSLPLHGFRLLVIQECPRLAIVKGKRNKFLINFSSVARNPTPLNLLSLGLHHHMIIFFCVGFDKGGFVINKPPHPISRSPFPPPKRAISKTKAPCLSKKLVAPTGYIDESDPENVSDDPASPNSSDPHFLSLIHFHQCSLIHSRVVTGFRGE